MPWAKNPWPGLFLWFSGVSRAPPHSDFLRRTSRARRRTLGLRRLASEGRPATSPARPCSRKARGRLGSVGSTREPTSPGWRSDVRSRNLRTCSRTRRPRRGGLGARARQFRAGTPGRDDAGAACFEGPSAVGRRTTPHRRVGGERRHRQGSPRNAGSYHEDPRSFRRGASAGPRGLGALRPGRNDSGTCPTRHHQSDPDR